MERCEHSPGVWWWDPARGISSAPDWRGSFHQAEIPGSALYREPASNPPRLRDQNSSQFFNSQLDVCFTDHSLAACTVLNVSRYRLQRAIRKQPSLQSLLPKGVLQELAFPAPAAICAEAVARTFHNHASTLPVRLNCFLVIAELSIHQVQAANVQSKVQGRQKLKPGPRLRPWIRAQIQVQV